MAGRGADTNVAMRASYGGFNPHLSGTSSTAAAVSAVAAETGASKDALKNAPPMKYSGRQLLTGGNKRKSHGGFGKSRFIRLMLAACVDATSRTLE